MKTRKALSRYLASFAMLSCSLLFVARPVAAISREVGRSGWITSMAGQHTSKWAKSHALLLNINKTSGNIMPGPRK
jgi:hypothetical protein